MNPTLPRASPQVTLRNKPAADKTRRRLCSRTRCASIPGTVPSAAPSTPIPRVLRPNPRARMILWISASVLGVWLLYVVVLFWALRSEAVRSAINKRPDKFFITWRSASSWFPGVFHVKGLHFIGQGTSSQYYGRMDDAQFRVRFLPLVRQKISVGTFHGRGIEFQLRRPPARGETNQPQPTFAPPIPGLETLPSRTSPRAGRGKPSWWIRVENVVFQDIEQIWMYDTRLQGPGTLSAALNMQIEGPFQVQARRLEFPHATVTHHGEKVATLLAIRLAGDMGPLTFGVDDVPDDRIFEFISADLHLAGDLGTLALLRERLGTHDSIQFGGEGRIEGDVRVAKGRLQLGTQLAIQSPKLQLNLSGYTVEGAATIEDRVASDGPQPLAKLDVRLRDLVISRNGKRLGSADGPVLNLTSESRNLSVTSGFRDADLTLRIEPFTLPDASWLTEFIPANSGIALTGGAIRMNADLRAAAQSPIHGELHLAGDAVSTQIHGSAYEGTLRLAVRLADGNGGPHVLHLANTELTVTNLVVPNLSRETQDGWHAILGIPEGRLDLTNQNWTLDSRFRIELRDTRPILAVLRNQPDAPGWLRLMPTIKELVGDGHITTTRELTQLSGFNLRGKSTDFRAELLLSTNRLSGIAYARYGPLAAGMDRRDPARNRWRLIGAKRWYERALATPHLPPANVEPEEPDDPKDLAP